MKRIIISVTNDLVTDQRIQKICETLFVESYNVLLIGRLLKSSEKFESNFQSYRFKLFFNKGFLFYAEYNLRLFFILLFSKKDILLANDLDTLLPNYLVSKILRKKLVYDSHELFTEVPELINRPFTQKTWLIIEGYILPKLKNCYTVCNSISNYYKLKYNTNFKVIRNFPKKIETNLAGSFPFDLNKNKTILYQGAINKGRGLELMLETMPFLEQVTFIIIGSGDITKQLQKKVINLNIEEKVKFIKKVTPKELQKLTPLANLGISIEENLGLNYKFALPNKLFDYIQAKVPVLVSDLPEMKNIVKTYKVGEIIKSRNPKNLAIQINTILNKEKNHYNKYLNIASNELIWENESKKLIELFKNVN